ncbi:Lsr2 family protein [Streptomyces sp. NPDC017448]|uniref:Lsr2 family protein n=1 Tax=Streptomyces sp. NPDC017448 TaxID=3364996 RepID=UPI00379C97C1
MAQRVVVTHIDDLTQKEGEDITTETFSLNGKMYEIDLSPANRAKLEKALKPFIEAGRKVKKGQAGTATRTAPSASGNKETAEIRAWAKENGHSVNERGRIPADIKALYLAAKS